MIRVGRRVYNKDGTYVDPSYEGFSKILCLTKSTEYGDLGPYILKNEKGQLMENIWQMSKIYEKVPFTKEYYSRYDKTIIWTYPAETHVINGKITDAYWKWREAGMNNKYPIRYPVGFKHRHKCLYSLKELNTVQDHISSDNYVQYNGTMYAKLGYIESRKQIYIPIYCDLVKRQPKFQELKNRLDKGENLLIIEVDGPHQESLDYYKEKYNVLDNFIVNNTIAINKENINIMLNDEKYPFGHGYCLALALLDKDKEWVQLHNAEIGIKVNIPNLTENKNKILVKGKRNKL
jgi:hypothetical protein